MKNLKLIKYIFHFWCYLTHNFFFTVSLRRKITTVKPSAMRNTYKWYTTVSPCPVFPGLRPWLVLATSRFNSNNYLPYSNNAGAHCMATAVKQIECLASDEHARRPGTVWKETKVNLGFTAERTCLNVNELFILKLRRSYLLSLYISDPFILICEAALSVIQHSAF